MSVVEFESVFKNFGARPAVLDFSLAVETGERLVLLGPSGCGKTTLLRLLAGFIAPDRGRIVVHGDAVADAGRILVGPETRGLGMVFQDLALWPHLSVRGNIEFGLRARRAPARERLERVREILALVQMEDYIDVRPGQLSGGQQQRVALARALVLRPKALLMDEPLSNLDAELNVRLRGEILRLQRLTGFTLFYVTHDRDEAEEIATRLVMMRAGRIERIEQAGGP